MYVYIVENVGVDDIWYIVGVFATRQAAEVFVGQRVLLGDASGAFFISDHIVEDEK